MADTGHMKGRPRKGSPFRDSALEFRPEIEGLRAVAIIPVLLVHAGFARVPGGFVGVDVFFVISGYLITRIILADMEQGGFRLARFYARRFARLGPALWTMLATVMAEGLWLLLPSDWPALSAAAIWSAGFGANLHFWLTTDYFATHETALLLHTWSLGLEEQFYLFYPVFLIAVRRWLPGREAIAIGAAGAVSLIISFVLSHHAPQAAFYLLPSRAWELALGGLIACGVGPRIKSEAACGILAAAGLAMIALAVVWITPAMPFPAPAALLPAIGAALVIAYGASGPACIALSLSPVRWIGRISYSTYLWHWPIMVFWRLEYGIAPDRWTRVGLVAASLIAGAVSYYAIERPAQKWMQAQTYRRVFRIAIGSFALLVLAALAANALAPSLRSGPAARMAVTLSNQAEERRQTQYRMGECFGYTIKMDACLRPSDADNDVAVLGTSYAAMLWRAVAEEYPDRAVHQATVLGCPPVMGAQGSADCIAANRSVFDRALSGEIEHLVLAARWFESDAPALSETVSKMRAAGVDVTVIGPPVEYDQSFPRILAIAERRDDPSHIERLRRSDRDPIDSILEKAVTQAGGRYISQLEFECPSSGGVRRCRTLASDGLPIHYDTGHLTLQAARDFVSAADPLAPSETRP
ncbi:MAG: acyltransferase family protein [Pseudomonadota bacterium]|nr:acyltransferase family protein [Pseudomonadota bacterium]